MMRPPIVCAARVLSLLLGHPRAKRTAAAAAAAAAAQPSAMLAHTVATSARAGEESKHGGIHHRTWHERNDEGEHRTLLPLRCHCATAALLTAALGTHYSHCD